MSVIIQVFLFLTLRCNSPHLLHLPVKYPVAKALILTHI